MNDFDRLAETVTPVMAEKWLNQNKNNRKLRDGVAEKYAADMTNGNWNRCPMPISFYADGDLADGQHRLFAIIESNTTQRFIVVRGLERKDGLNIDTGLNRSIVDNARISGKDQHLSTALIAVARAIDSGNAKSHGPAADSNAAKLDVTALHREAATWAISNGPRARFLKNAVVLGAIGRAYYHETDKNKLKRFCDVMQNGLADGTHEHAAVTLRNYLLLKGTFCTSSAMWRDTFIKVQNCIKYFMLGKSLSVIKTVADEAYPLKGPVKPTAKKLARKA